MLKSGMNGDLDSSLKSHAAKYLNDDRLTAELLRIALSKDPDRDDEEYWQPIAVLQHRLSGILGEIRQLVAGADDKGRDVAVTVLGQGRVRNKFSPETCAEILLAMLDQERSNAVLSSIIFALGHLHAGNVIVPVARLRSHPDPDVRYSVVSTLSGYKDSVAVDALIECTSDSDVSVRDWATFGLGSQIDLDTPAIRDALYNRLNDPDDDVRGEAMVGLALRGDVRVAKTLIREIERLNQKKMGFGLLIEEAISEVLNHADTVEWLPLLNRLMELNIGGDREIHEAIGRCTGA